MPEFRLYPLNREASDLKAFLAREPKAEKFIKRLIGSKEYINNKARYCLWLKEATPSELRQMPAIMERMERVRKMREASSDAATRRLADQPHLFRETNNPETYIVVPSVSSVNTPSYEVPSIVCFGHFLSAFL